MFSTNFLLAFFIILLVLIQFPQSSRGEENRHCDPSSCGNIRNISHPFRLNGDPKNCGERRYELVCENNIAVLHLYSQKYYVQAINYGNYTIRLVDPGLQKNNCSSVPQYSLSEYNFSYEDAYTIYKRKWEGRWPPPQITKPITFLSCPYSVNSILYVDSSTCSSTNSSLSSSIGRQYSYAIVGQLNASQVRDLCRIDSVSMTSLELKDGDYNLSFSEIHNALLYGFELSWFKCRNCTGYCYLDEANHEQCLPQGGKKSTVGTFTRFLVFFSICELSLL